MQRESKHLLPVNQADYRKSIKHYEKALDKGAGKEVRRRMNRVRTEMDERGIGMGGFRLVDDGAPTIYGIFAIVVVGMLLLVSLRYTDEGLNLSSLFNNDEDTIRLIFQVQILLNNNFLCSSRNFYSGNCNCHALIR